MKDSTRNICWIEYWIYFETFSIRGSQNKIIQYAHRKKTGHQNRLLTKHAILKKKSGKAKYSNSLVKTSGNYFPWKYFHASGQSVPIQSKVKSVV